MFDDYPAILAFALKFAQLTTPGQRLIYTFVTQTGDYKLIVQHVLVALDVALTGHVHFAWLIWAGNLLGLGIGWPLWRICFRDEPDFRLRLILFVPVMFLLFGMVYVENYDWAMCGLQTFPVVFFSLLGLDCMFRGSARGTALACVYACLACFSSSNGFLLAPIGTYVYFRRKAWLPMAVWALTFLFSAAVYMYRYVAPFGVVSNGNTAFRNQVLFFLSFLGSAVENQHRQPVRYGAVLLGIALVSVFVWALGQRFNRRSPAAIAVVTWIGLTAVLVVLYRLPAGFQYSLIMRYKIYSDLLLVLCYSFLASSFRSSSVTPAAKKAVYASALALAICFCAVSDRIGYKFLQKRQQRVALGLRNYVLDPTQTPQITVSGDPIDAWQNERARLALSEAISSGMYELPPESLR